MSHPPKIEGGIFYKNERKNMQFHTRGFTKIMTNLETQENFLDQSRKKEQGKEMHFFFASY